MRAGPRRTYRRTIKRTATGERRSKDCIAGASFQPSKRSSKIREASLAAVAAERDPRARPPRGAAEHPLRPGAVRRNPADGRSSIHRSAPSCCGLPEPGADFKGRAQGELKSRTRGRADRGGAARREQRGSLYAEVTTRIIAELEAGRCAWVQPWDNVAAAPGLAGNAVSGRSYSGSTSCSCGARPSSAAIRARTG
jgi:N-terminal domain of anti-restriction factor ArdC